MSAMLLPGSLRRGTPGVKEAECSSRFVAVALPVTERDLGSSSRGLLPHRGLPTRRLGGKISSRNSYRQRETRKGVTVSDTMLNKGK
eukprot:469033-Rhodomonas_salina.2